MLDGLQTGEESLGTPEPEDPRPGPLPLGLSVCSSLGGRGTPLTGWLDSQAETQGENITEFTEPLNKFIQ